jgi:hypothetical protein
MLKIYGATAVYAVTATTTGVKKKQIIGGGKEKH